MIIYNPSIHLTIFPLFGAFLTDSYKVSCFWLNFKLWLKPVKQLQNYLNTINCSFRESLRCLSNRPAQPSGAMFSCLFPECWTYSDKKPKMLQMSGHNMFSESMSWPSISSYLPYAAMNTCQPDWRGWGEEICRLPRERTPAGSLTISQSIISELMVQYVQTGTVDQKWLGTSHIRSDNQERWATVNGF